MSASYRQESARNQQLIAEAPAQGCILQGDMFLTAEDEKNETDRNHNRVQHWSDEFAIINLKNQVFGTEIGFGEPQASLSHDKVILRSVHARVRYDTTAKTAAAAL